MKSTIKQISLDQNPLVQLLFIEHLKILHWSLHFGFSKFFHGGEYLKSFYIFTELLEVNAIKIGTEM